MSEPNRKTARLEDVARLAQVSSATVSRYFNSPDVVAERTAKRIEDAIGRLGYVPNLMAGGLASNRSKLVAVFVPEIAHSLFNDAIEEMVDGLSAQGYSVMLAMTRANNARLSKLVDMALGRRVDAVILTGVVSDRETRDKLRSHNVTTIETWGLPADPIDVAVGFSHREVGRETARFARAKGYSRPFLVSASGGRGEARRTGFEDAWADAGGTKPGGVEVSTPTSFAQGFEVFQTIRAQDPMPDLVVCASDWLALGVLFAAREAGLQVPGDLAVIGFGNLSIAAEMRPAITSVNIDGELLGRQAAEVLRRKALGEDVPRHTDVGFRIIERDSA